MDMDRKYYINADQLQILDEGSLPRGYYWYKIAVVADGFIIEYSNTLKVYAPHKNNTIGLFWDKFADEITYKLTRWTVDEKGSILVGNPPYYFDNGLIEFQ